MLVKIASLSCISLECWGLERKVFGISSRMAMGISVGRRILG
jgi:hypothetical protein